MSFRKKFFLFLLIGIPQIYAKSVYQYCRLIKDLETSITQKNTKKANEILAEIEKSKRADQNLISIKTYFAKNTKKYESLKTQTQKLAPIIPVVPAPVVAPKPSTPSAPKSLLEQIRAGQRLAEHQITPRERLDQLLQNLKKIKLLEPYYEKIKKEHEIISNFIEMTKALFENGAINKAKIEENLKIVNNVEPLIQFWFQKWQELYSPDASPIQIGFLRRLIQQRPSEYTNYANFKEQYAQIERLQADQSYQEFLKKKEAQKEDIKKNMQSRLNKIIENIKKITIKDLITSKEFKLLNEYAEMTRSLFDETSAELNILRLEYLEGLLNIFMNAKFIEIFAKSSGNLQSALKIFLSEPEKLKVVLDNFQALENDPIFKKYLFDKEEAERKEREQQRAQMGLYRPSTPAVEAIQAKKKAAEQPQRPPLKRVPTAATGPKVSALMQKFQKQ